MRRRSFHTPPDSLQLDGSIASFLHFRQARFDGADEKRHHLLNCEATRLPYWRRRPALRSGVATVHFASDISIRTTQETMFRNQMCIIVLPANVYCD
jgi:hypothetical protein